MCLLETKTDERKTKSVIQFVVLGQSGTNSVESYLAQLWPNLKKGRFGPRSNFLGQALKRWSSHKSESWILLMPSSPPPEPLESPRPSRPRRWSLRILLHNVQRGRSEGRSGTTASASVAEPGIPLGLPQTQEARPLSRVTGSQVLQLSMLSALTLLTGTLCYSQNWILR